MLSGHGECRHSAAYSPDGTRIVTASNDKTARIWDARHRGAARRALRPWRCVNSAAYSPDGTRIVTASDDKTARIWDARTGPQLAVLPGMAIRQIRRLLARRHAHRHRVGRRTARIWDARTGALLAVLRATAIASIPPPIRPTARASSPHRPTRPPASGMRAPGAARGALRPWRSRLFRRLLARWHAHRHRVGGQDRSDLGCPHGRAAHRALRAWRCRRSAAYSPDGTRIVTASEDKTARIWDARTGSQLAVLAAMAVASIPPPTRPTALASSQRPLTRPRASGMRARRTARDALRNWLRLFRRLLTGWDPHRHRYIDKAARIWDALTGAELAVLPGHVENVESAAYSPDGTRIVTSSEDRTARIWDARVPATLDDQIAWDAAAQSDLLSDADQPGLVCQPPREQASS